MFSCLAARRSAPARPRIKSPITQPEMPERTPAAATPRPAVSIGSRRTVPVAARRRRRIETGGRGAALRAHEETRSQDETRKGRDLAEEIIKALPRATDIANELKGTKSICYWYANLDVPRDSEGEFQRIVANTGATISDVRWWVYPLGVDQSSDEYRNSPYANLSAAVKCFATGFAIYAPTIKPGKYENRFHRK